MKSWKVSKYNVMWSEVGDWSCTCPDYFYRREVNHTRCKHIKEKMNMIEQKIKEYHEEMSDEQIQEELVSQGLSMPTVYISRVRACQRIPHHCGGDRY